MAILLRLVPRIGPFRGLSFNNPTPQTEDLYFKSINLTVERYRAYLHEAASNSIVLPDCDLDDGKATKAAEYTLTDDTYAKLLEQLSGRKFQGTSPELRDNILNFYSDLSAPYHTKKDPNEWNKVLADLDQLKAITPVSVDTSARQSRPVKESAEIYACGQ